MKGLTSREQRAAIQKVMEDEGITDAQIQTLLVDNPADWLCGKE